jgi:methionine-R-sulfoxide reductase
LRRRFDDGHLTDFERWVIFKKGTEPPFQNKYWNHFERGVYVCKLCRQPLFRSEDKFLSYSGWPSFDSSIPGSVKEVPEEFPDDRIEVVCSRCGAHLGHVFYGEGYTEKDVRYCINSASIDFVPEDEDGADRAP